jgi:2-polyprenyl-6-methoxyphenol hydroxylase-like FAD-dependent oxidoreductase
MTHFDNNQHAIVIGGSMAGMMAAKVLSNYFEQVTIIERDSPHEGTQARKGVPQGNHAHVLLKRGEQALGRLFPGIWQEMEALGSQNVDMAEKMHWFHCGVWKVRFNSNFPIYLQSRPLLEWKVRNRLARVGNVNFRYNTIVSHLLTSADKSRVTGVQIRQDGYVSELTTDLIVDASGRGSQTPRWLQELGYEVPTESTVKINLGYASRLYRPASHQTPDWQGLVVYPRIPESKRQGLVFRVEHDKWLVTLVGYAGDHPSQKEDEFMSFAESLAHPIVAQTLKQATPVSDIKTFKYPKEVRRHYEKLQRIPDGLLVLGDAFCSFDPVFGQGMSVAAMEAEALDRCLHQANGKVPGLSRHFHKRIAKLVIVPWLLATGEGLRFEEVEGKRPFYLKALHWYNTQIFELTGESEAVYADFLQVLHLMKLPTLLFHPRNLWQVLRHHLGKREVVVNGRPAQAWATSGD